MTAGKHMSMCPTMEKQSTLHLCSLNTTLSPSYSSQKERLREQGVSVAFIHPLSLHLSFLSS